MKSRRFPFNGFTKLRYKKFAFIRLVFKFKTSTSPRSTQNLCVPVSPRSTQKPLRLRDLVFIQNSYYKNRPLPLLIL